MTARQDARHYQQKTAYSQTHACSDKDINTLAQAANHERGGSATQGIQNNHAIAQPCETSAIRCTKIQGQDSRKTEYTANKFVERHLVAFEESAGEDNNQKDTH